MATQTLRTRFEKFDPPIKVAGWFAHLAEITERVVTDGRTETVTTLDVAPVWNVTPEALVAEFAERKTEAAAALTKRQQELDAKIVLVETAPTTEKDDKPL